MKAIFALFLSVLSLTAQVITTPPRNNTSSGTTITNLNATQFVVGADGTITIKDGASITNAALTTPSAGTATGTQTRLGAGSEGSPTYTFSGDPDTGIFSSAANLLGISVGGTERWDFSSTAFVPTIDNTYDIGNGSVNPRDVNVSRNVLVAGALSVHGAVTANSGVFTNSLSVGGNNVITTANISDVAAAPSWNGVTTVSPSKNAIYDYFHTFDTDDDGLPDKLDLNSAGFVRTTSGGVISSTELSGDATTSGSGVLTLSASGVTAATYGDATHVGQFTVDAKGRITTASAVAISGVGGTSDNWTASGTTNSTLTGKAYADSGVFTNGVTFGGGTARGYVMFGDDDNSNAYFLQATNAMTTNIVETQPVAPYPGVLYWTLLSDGTNVLRNATNTLAGLNSILGSSIIESTSISDTAEASSWNGATTIAPSKNAVYDYVHTFDTDDDGLPDKLDLSAAGFVRTTSGGVISSAEISGDATTSGSGVLTIANSAITTAKIAANAVDGTKIALGSDAQGDVMYYNGTDYVRLPPGTSGQVLQTQGAGANPMWGNSGSITEIGGPLFVSTADSTVANTVTETSVIGATGTGSKTLPANYLTVGKNIHVVVRGRMGTKTIAPGALTIKFKVGSTVLATNIFSPTASLANDYVEFVGDFTCRTIGATGTVFAQSNFDYNDGVTTPVNRPINANSATVTIDTTTTLVVDVTATWATADPSNTVTGSISLIEDGTGGTLTATAGSLTSNALVLGAGGVDTKVAPGLTTDGTSVITAGVAGTSAGALIFKNATSGQITLQPATGALGTVAATFPASDTKIPIISQVVTISGPTAARTITVPDANFAAARTDAANTFTGHQTVEGVTSTGATGTGNFVFSIAPTITGHPTIEGVTATGATGTGNFVFSISPTITGHETIEGVTATGATGTGKFVFDIDPLFSPTFTLAGNPALAAGGVGFATTGLIFEGATADTFETLLTVTDPTADRTVTFPDADTKIPVISQVLTVSGPTAARTITVPDANFTVARTDAANTFTGHQTIEGVTSTGATGTGKFVFDASPTIVTPTIADFSNATHNHQNAAGGGALSAAAITSGTLATAQMPALTGDTTTSAGTVATTTASASGSWAFKGLISPSQITANQNDYNPTSLSSSAILRVTSDASRNITGLQTANTVGDVKIIWNVGSNPIVLLNQSTSSQTTNRFLLGADLTLGADTSVRLVYDTTTSRWRAGSYFGGTTGTGKLVLDNAPTISGHPTIEGVTSTGATGTGKHVFDGSPTLVTPTIGVATATTVNKWTFTAPTTGATLAAGADNVVYTGPAATDTLVGRASTDTLTNKRITARITTITSSGTPTVNTDNTDAVTITAQAAAITSMTTNLSGTPNNFDQIFYRIKDDGTARAITWGASFASRGATLPTTTTVSKVLYVLFVYNTVTSTWDCISTATEA